MASGLGRTFKESVAKISGGVPKNKGHYECLLFCNCIGTEIRGKLGAHEPKVVMNEVYNKLEKFTSQGNCTNLYPDISWDIFERGKKIFDCNYDYATLQGKKENTYTRCLRYKENLDDAKEAYRKVKEICTDGGTDKYCREFLKKNGDQKYKQPQELTCPEEEKTLSDSDSEEQSDYDGTGTEGILGSKQLEKVKSELKEYQELERGSKDCDNGSKVRELGGILTSYTLVQNGAQEIVDAWCYAHKKWAVSLPKDDLCYALYFWIGHTILENRKYADDLWGIMKAIYPKLTTWKPIKGCDSVGTKIDEDTFNERKQVFEYIQQCKIMKKQLEQSRRSASSNNKAKCEQSYYTHLEDVIKKLTAEETKCKQEQGGSANDPYCKRFLAMCQQCDPKDLSKLKCEKVEPKTEESTTSNYQAPSTEDTITSPSEGSNNTTTTIAVPSALAAVGLPTIAAFLLYKYNILPSWFHNTFGNSTGRSRNSNKRRNRRSTNSNFSALTDDDTLTTINSSEYSIPYTSSST
ncbi:KIR protein [Plasmodium coatneyi]|uniref:KIR protein n=1 Tax=Plasmodium coatneyi TaxID=208452 RepID=A0A1B1E5L0_9APIC|nr:KIR protein [Plasmodium coatneyi]ANQ10314.1 KIR protein [Plasmodium coatneyi]